VSECFVLLRWRQGRHAEPDDVTVHSVHLTEQSVIDRVASIAAANSQYPMRKVGAGNWTVGPTGDEGFFGNTPVNLKMIRSKLTDAS
jgi:hypothetical protein